MIPFRYEFILFYQFVGGQMTLVNKVQEKTWEVIDDSHRFFTNYHIFPYQSTTNVMQNVSRAVGKISYIDSAKIS